MTGLWVGLGKCRPQRRGSQTAIPSPWTASFVPFQFFQSGQEGGARKSENFLGTALQPWKAARCPSLVALTRGTLGRSHSLSAWGWCVAWDEGTVLFLPMKLKVSDAQWVEIGSDFFLKADAWEIWRSGNVRGVRCLIFPSCWVSRCRTWRLISFHHWLALIRNSGKYLLIPGRGGWDFKCHPFKNHWMLH